MIMMVVVMVVMMMMMIMTTPVDLPNKEGFTALYAAVGFGRNDVAELVRR
jgi:hypothetical protein